MGEKLLEKFMESAKSVLPISAIVIILGLTIAPMSLGTIVLFITGTFFLIFGMSLFTLGTDVALMPMGELIGSKLAGSRKIGILIIGGFILGAVITFAEPDLQVLTKQVPAIPDMLLIISIAVGVGIFLVIALLRILFQVKMHYLLLAAYGVVFIVAAITNPQFVPIGFDSGGVTTGPITVPFIMALGTGVSLVRSGKSAEEDSFGLCGICSIGPILAVLILGIFFKPTESNLAYETVETVDSIRELLSLYGHGFVEFGKEVIMSLLPIVVVFALFQILRFKLPKTQLIKILVGIVYTLIGLTIFLTGVNIGFLPAGTLLGRTLGALSYNWILIPLGMIIGFFVIAAEPAVYVLNKQVEEVTNGAISKKMMMAGLSIGEALAIALATIRVMSGISIWYFILPGYVLAIILSFVVPHIFTAIAFDSGGVASGAMAAAFILPFIKGVCEAVGGNIMTDAFGIIALVAMMPLITVQIMGVIYEFKLKRTEKVESEQDQDDGLVEDIDVIDL